MFRKVKSTVIALAIAVLTVSGNSLFCHAQRAEKSTEQSSEGQATESPDASDRGEKQTGEGQNGEGQNGEGQNGEGQAGAGKGSRDTQVEPEALESEDFQGENSKQDETVQAEATPQAAKVKISKELPVLRLPRYFAGLIDQSQRSQIQSIQLQFRSRIDQLEEELRNLKQEELDALEQVLTASQRKLLDKKRQQSKAPRVAVDLSEHEDPSAAR